jgi:hypothetical protein
MCAVKLVLCPSAYHEDVCFVDGVLITCLNR